MTRISQFLILNKSSSLLLENRKMNKMPRRTSVNDVKDLDDLNELEYLVKDKRVDKRAESKKIRRNRHYSKVLIKSQLKDYRTEINCNEDSI